MECTHQVIVHKIIVNSCVLMSCTPCNKIEIYAAAPKTGVETQRYGTRKINTKVVKIPL
jgi:hypothetical protein